MKDFKEETKFGKAHADMWKNWGRAQGQNFSEQLKNFSDYPT